MKYLILVILLALTMGACSKSDTSGTNNTGGGTSGQGGSLARFTIAGNYLYVVDDSKLYAYSISQSDRPQLKSNVNIGFAIETIYPYGDKLFIGSQSAMYVYSIADPEVPVLLGAASHVRSCDPVVANDTFAYVTVRSGSNCGGNVNALMVYSLTNIMQPRQLNTVALENPWGLGISGNRLFVCNGSNGLNTYDITNPAKPSLVRKLQTESFYDVIITPDRMLIAMIQDGMALYQISNTSDSLALLSKITK